MELKQTGIIKIVVYDSHPECCDAWCPYHFGGRSPNCCGRYFFSSALEFSEHYGRRIRLTKRNINCIKEFGVPASVPTDDRE